MHLISQYFIYKSDKIEMDSFASHIKPKGKKAKDMKKPMNWHLHGTRTEN